jgi:hypothetical protein
MNTIHNARVQLLATILNNMALAVIVAGFIAPVVTGQLLTGGRFFVGLLCWVSGAFLHIIAQFTLGRLRP